LKNAKKPDAKKLNESGLLKKKVKEEEPKSQREYGLVTTKNVNFATAVQETKDLQPPLNHGYYKSKKP